MSFAADVKNELCKAEHSRKQLELLSKGAAYAMTEDGEGCFHCVFVSYFYSDNCSFTGICYP